MGRKACAETAPARSVVEIAVKTQRTQHGIDETPVEKSLRREERYTRE